ncbi:hypothetical protein J4221_02950 [Candidatus Pacearchaeota archaeon]|nr:hypothetical protein [Candidatus Pacearchaeota archaeon]
MDKDLSLLLKDLKSNDLAIRESSMEQLRNYKERRAVKSLIRVAQGKLRRWIPPSWYTLEDQLNAISALSEIDDKKAKDYVISLTEYKIWESFIEPQSTIADFFPPPGPASATYYVYFNLRGHMSGLREIGNRESDRHIPSQWNPKISTTFLGKGNSPKYLPEGRIKDVIVTAQEKIRNRKK